MKHLIVLLLIALFTKFAFGQIDSTALKICVERGHIEGVQIQNVLIFPPRVVDLDTVSYTITWNQQYLTATCSRCGSRIATPMRTSADTVITWIKEEEKPDDIPPEE